MKFLTAILFALGLTASAHAQTAGELAAKCRIAHSVEKRIREHNTPIPPSDYAAGAYCQGYVVGALDALFFSGVKQTEAGRGAINSNECF